MKRGDKRASLTIRLTVTELRTVDRASSRSNLDRSAFVRKAVMDASVGVTAPNQPEATQRPEKLASRPIRTVEDAQRAVAGIKRPLVSSFDPDATQ